MRQGQSPWAADHVVEVRRGSGTAWIPPMELLRTRPSILRMPLLVRPLAVSAPLLALTASLLAGCSGSVTRVEDSAVVPVSEALPTPEISVYRSYPQDGPIDDVWVVMPGIDRNAEEYRDYWAEAAAGTRVLVLTPEFPEADYPGSNGYNLANMLDQDGDPNPQDQWLFGAIEDVFDEAKQEFALPQETYRIFGHAAGAAFVTRMATFAPDARICHAYPANAGWYTVPDEAVKFPYGLAEAPAPGADLPAAFAVPMTLLLGADDTDGQDQNLRRDKPTDAQGENRLARGQYFYDAATAKAEELGLPLAWVEDIVPDVGHNGRAMSQVALSLAEEEPACR